MLKVMDELEIDDNFQDDQVLEASQNLILWFVDFSNYLANDLIQKCMSFQQHIRFMHEVKKFFQNEPYFFECVLMV